MSQCGRSLLFPFLVIMCCNYVMLCFTWEPKVNHHEMLPLLCAAHQGKVRISKEEGGTGEKGYDPDAHSIIAGPVVVVEYADHLWWIFCIYISLCCNGSKNHNGKHLEFPGLEKGKWKWGEVQKHFKGTKFFPPKFTEN